MAIWPSHLYSGVLCQWANESALQSDNSNVIQIIALSLTARILERLKLLVLDQLVDKR